MSGGQSQKTRRPGSAFLQVQLDEASQLPLLSSVLHDTHVLLRTNGYLALVLVDISPLGRIETEYGSAVYNRTIHQITADIQTLYGSVLLPGDLLCSVRPYGEQLVIFLAGPRGERLLRGGELEGVVDRIWMALTPRVMELTQSFGKRDSVRLGYSLILPNSMVQPERLIYRAVDEAVDMAFDHSRRVTARARERLRDLLVHRRLHIVFQPIISLSDMAVRGYEALVRGPARSQWVMPATLFGLAAQADLVGELAQACFDLSLADFGSLPTGTFLFANVWPSLVNDEAFRASLLRSLREVDPARLVLELYEGAAVYNHTILAQSLADLRNSGVRIAIDDLGVGHANLDHVLRLHPDFLKLDISLIQQIEDSPAKQAVVSSLLSIGNTVAATVIAEGVERAPEYEAVSRLGVPWAQGFHFARPRPGFILPRKLRRYSKLKRVSDGH